MKLTGYVAQTVERTRARKLRMAVEEFNAEYGAMLDGGEIERWPEFFTDDAVYRVTSRENADAGLPVGLVYCEGKNMMHDRAVAIARTQMFAPRTNLHMCSNVRIISEEANGDFVAHTNFILLQNLVEGPTTIHLAGRYYDCFMQSENGLLLKERQAVYDTTVIANDVVYPV